MPKTLGTNKRKIYLSFFFQMISLIFILSVKFTNKKSLFFDATQQSRVQSNMNDSLTLLILKLLRWNHYLFLSLEFLMHIVR